MWATMSRTDHVPSHTSVMCSSFSPCKVSCSALYSRAASFSSPSFVVAATTSLLDGPGLVGAGPDLLVELLQLVGGEVARLADADDLALVGLDLGHRLGD